VTAAAVVTVPLLDETPEPPPRDRIRVLKRHLIDALRTLRGARHPHRLIQKTSPVPEGFTATVLEAACATCQGFCCKGGGDHAYIDERTMARVRRDHPGHDTRAIINLYLDRVAPSSYRGSCLFHGAEGCTLDRRLRAELCNAYYCNGLRVFLNQSPQPRQVRIVASRGGKERRSSVMTTVGHDKMCEPTGEMP